MAIVIPWARVLVAGDYLSTVEPPTLNDGGDRDAYLATLERLRPLVASVDTSSPVTARCSTPRGRSRCWRRTSPLPEAVR